MNRNEMERTMKALWRSGAGPAPFAPVPSMEAWQADVMRSVRLAADRTARAEAELWPALLRAATLLLLVTLLGWTAVWRAFPPAAEQTGAQTAAPAWERVEIVPTDAF